MDLSDGFPRRRSSVGPRDRGDVSDASLPTVYRESAPLRCANGQ